MSCAVLIAAWVSATPAPVLAQAAPGTVAYPSCDPGAAPPVPSIKADWQAYCAKQAGQAAAAAPTQAPAISYPYCNPEGAPPDPRVRAEWQASCAAQQQQQQGATP